MAAEANQDLAQQELVTELEMLQNINSERLTANALSLQKELDKLRLEQIKLGAQKNALNIIDGANNHFYKEIASDELLKLTEERTKTFLNFSSIQAALRCNQANEMLIQTLHLQKSEDLLLEPEEEAYVKELLEELRELAQELLNNQEVGTEQEINIIEARTELAGLLCRYQELRNQAGPVLFKGDDKEKATLVLEKNLAKEDCRLNQMRLMIQKLMIGEKKFGMRFDKETNAHFKEMFMKCGLKPHQFRSQAMEHQD